MAVYWLTFRLEDGPDYKDRYDALIAVVTDMMTRWWVESSAFILFSSDLDIDSVAAEVKRTINQTTDIVLIGMPDYKSARAIGAIKDKDLFELMPFTKKA